MTEGYCESCEHLDDSAKHRPSRVWLCRAFRRREKVGGVVAGEWSKDEPFGRCVEFNERYICPMWAQRKEPTE